MNKNHLSKTYLKFVINQQEFLAVAKVSGRWYMSNEYAYESCKAVILEENSRPD